MSSDYEWPFWPFFLDVGVIRQPRKQGKQTKGLGSAPWALIDAKKLCVREINANMSIMRKKSIIGNM